MDSSSVRLIDHIIGGYLSNSVTFYRTFGSLDVRVAALEALVEVLRAESRMEDWEFLLDLIENDPEPRVRHQLLLMLAKHPPFERGRGNRLDTIPVMDRLWKLMKYVIDP